VTCGVSTEHKWLMHLTETDQEDTAMTLTDIAVSLTGERSLAKYTAVASARHEMRSPGLLTTSMRHAGGRMATTSMTGCPPNRNLRTIIDR
jgi:hypothetical protein